MTNAEVSLFQTTASLDKSMYLIGYRSSSASPTQPTMHKSPCQTSSTCSPTSTKIAAVYTSAVYVTVITAVYSPEVVTTELESTYYNYETGKLMQKSTCHTVDVL